MSLIIKCTNCDKKYSAYSDTIKVRGTIVETNCPHCNKHTMSNISRFCEDQVGHVDNRLHRARLILQLSHVISKLLNDDYCV